MFRFTQQKLNYLETFYQVRALDFVLDVLLFSFQGSINFVFGCRNSNSLNLTSYQEDVKHFFNSFLKINYGAGEGNRTLIISLEG